MCDFDGIKCSYMHTYTHSTTEGNSHRHASIVCLRTLNKTYYFTASILIAKTSGWLSFPIFHAVEYMCVCVSVRLCVIKCPFGKWKQRF